VFVRCDQAGFCGRWQTVGIVRVAAHQKPVCLRPLRGLVTRYDE